MGTFEQMLATPPSWLDASGPTSNVVLSTRVRLARNLRGVAFPARADRAGLERVRDRILAAASAGNYLAGALVLIMDESSQSQRQILVERHLTGRGFAEDGHGRAVVIGDRELVSVVINEEDHLRLASLRSGLQPMDAWRLVDRIDAELEQNLHYAYSSDWGYLTSCPTNVGTGMRVSVLIHLVGLVRRDRIAQVLGSISKLGLSVRGFYGEKSTALGGFFQISNQMTLGQSEDDIAYTVERVAGQLVTLELEARSELAEKGGRKVEDEVHRAFGILTSARIISSDETMALCSSLRFGISEGFIDSVDLATVNRLLVSTQPGHLKCFDARDPGPEQRDRMRADLIRRELASGSGA